MISDSFITRVVSASEGTSIQPMISSGAPAATAASRTSFAAAIVHPFALGWGLKMIAFLVFSARRALNIAVEVGFVVGITAAMRPIGSAIFLIP